MSAKKVNVQDPNREIGVHVYITNGTEDEIRAAIVGMDNYNPSVYGWQIRVSRIIKECGNGDVSDLLEISYEHEDVQNGEPSVVRIVGNQVWQRNLSRIGPSALESALKSAGLSVRGCFHIRMKQDEAFGIRTPKPYDPKG